MAFYIKKTSGEMEEFDVNKFKRSLQRPGAPHEIVEKIANDVQNNINKFQTTEDIYRYAIDKLYDENPGLAIRYNLKRALLEFGPTGYPFEKFVAEILKTRGYETKLDQIVSGWCVDHEVDLIIKRADENGMVECKFHNQAFFKTDVQVTLYTEARFHDISRLWTPDSKFDKLTHTWVFTNTKFTYEAIKYGNCSKMRLTSWDYPKEDSLAKMIDEAGLHPITALVSLNKRQKAELIEHGIVLCKNLPEKVNELRRIGLKDFKINKIINEAKSANLI